MAKYPQSHLAGRAVGGVGVGMSRLSGIRERVKAAPQSPANEDALIRLDWEIREQEIERELEIIRRARLLYTAYQNTGLMTVILKTGQRIEQRPYPGRTTLDHIRNARSTAEWLASLVVDEA